MSGKKSEKNVELFENWTFSKINYIIFGIGLVFIVLGYLIMATGSVNSAQSLTVAPIMLLVGYLILVPLALIYKRKQ
jgi:dipeptide/tripeptide permease